MKSRGGKDAPTTPGAQGQTNASLGTLASITFLTQPKRVFGASDRVRVAVVGVRGQGFTHVEEYCKLPDVEIAALCDVDENVMSERLEAIAKPSARRS